MKYIFDETKFTPLCEIMGRHGSDKGHIDTIIQHFTTAFLRTNVMKT